MNLISLRIVRRILIWIIILVALSVLANYVYTRYLEDRTEISDLPVLGSETVQSTRSVEYSDFRDGMLRFRIIAQQLVETRQGKNFLQGIEALDINPDGSVRNKIYSKNALYDKENRTVDFIGDVRLFLGESIELHTESLHYDLKSNIGETKEAVQFYSESVTGEAHGLTYNLNNRLLELKDSVDLLIVPQESDVDEVDSQEEFHAISKRALTYENLKRIELLGDARLESDTFLLTGDAIEARMNLNEKKIQSLSAEGNVEYRSAYLERSRAMTGDRMIFRFHPESRNPQKISVMGHSILELTSEDETERLQAQEIDLKLNPQLGVLSVIDSRIGAELEIERNSQRILISGEDFHAVFFQDTQGLKRIDVRQKAGIFTGSTDGPERNEISADNITMDFARKAGESALKALRATDSARWTFQTVGTRNSSPSKTAGQIAASEIEMRYNVSDGSLNRVDARKNVVMTDLSSVETSARRTSTIWAEKTQFNFFPGTNRPKDMVAEGGVRILQKSEPDLNSGEKSREIHTSSDKMKALFAPDTDGIVLLSSSQWGHFKYRDNSSSASSGRCEFDAQKEKIVLSESPEIFFEMGSTTGKTVEFDQKREVVHVYGNVRSVISGENSRGFLGASPSDPGSIVLAEVMDYDTNSGFIRYSQNVYLLSEDQQLQADALEAAPGGSRIKAFGNVLHRILRTQGTNPGIEVSGKTQPSDSNTEGKSAEKPISIKSAKLEYVKEANKVTYSGDVSLSTTDLLIKSRLLEAILDDNGKSIERATARDDVMIFKENWECKKGEIAYYYSNPEKFIVTGSPLEFFDPEGRRSLPHRLTYIVADGRIQLEKRGN